jgi:hypothetical protein
MTRIALSPDAPPVAGHPGDEFSFLCPTTLSEYRIAVTGVGQDVVIGLWGPNDPELGKARNASGQTFIDKMLGQGAWRITVDNAPGPYTIGITTRTWRERIFG